ncbi:MAG: hypothetical protein J5764_03290, partial [Bacteroidales bacterium]|nr:hypothetical protein [Bacteroidales bacterium]
DLYHCRASSRNPQDNNLTRVKGPLMTADSQGNIIIGSHKDKLIAVKGLKDFVVVDRGDVLMICPREDAEAEEFLSMLSLPEYEKYR